MLPIRPPKDIENWLVELAANTGRAKTFYTHAPSFLWRTVTILDGGGLIGFGGLPELPSTHTVRFRTKLARNPGATESAFS
jgi:hypothetical protein